MYYKKRPTDTGSHHRDTYEQNYHSENCFCLYRKLGKKSEVTERNEISTSRHFWVASALLLILAAGLVVRWSMVHYNLPVAANVDERRGLQVLYLFETKSLNPEFFNYPSLYYYLTYFLIRPIAGMEEFLVYGRVVNLLFACGLGTATFLLSRRIFQSNGAGLLAAGFTVFSPIILYNGSYIITDILATTLSLMGIIFFTRFFQEGTSKHWVLGVVTTGLAVSTKYTAGILVAAYLIMEFLHPGQPIPAPAQTDRLGHFLNRRFATSLPPTLLFLSGIVLIGFFLFFPAASLISLIKGQSHLNTTLTTRELTFLDSLPQKSFILGILVLSLAGVLYGFQTFSGRFCRYRPYLAVLVIGLVFLAGSPYVAISWKSFLYGFGTELKNNMASSNSRHWLTYPCVYVSWESITALVFFPIGLISALRQKRSVGLAGLYLLLCFVSIGSATRWYERYLTPLLPVVFIFSAWGIWSVLEWIKRHRPAAGHAFMVILILIAGWELNPKISRIIQWTHRPDPVNQAYHVVTQYPPRKVLYLGWTPYAELAIKGYKTTEVPRSWLKDPKGKIASELQTGDFLILDRENEKNAYKDALSGMKLIWSTDWKHGAYVYQKE